MTATLRQTATLDFEHGIATTCERRGCDTTDGPKHVWIASGEFGRDSLVVYCPDCSETVATPRPGYSYIGEVTAYGGGDDE